MSGYIGNIPTPQATQTRQSFTATASQTSFATAGYTPGFVDVFLNGVHLLDGTDYTASNGSDVVLTTGAASGDTLEVVAYSTFQLANQSFTGDFSVDSPTFVVDSTNNRVGIGTATPTNGRKLHVFDSGDAILRVETTTVGGDGRLELVGDNTGVSQIRFGDQDVVNVGLLTYDHSDNSMAFTTNSSERMRLDSTGGLNLLTGQLLMAGNTTYQILGITGGESTLTYTSTTTTADPGAPMSTGVAYSPTTSTSKLIVVWRARGRIARTVSTGNDSRGAVTLRYYDGTTYTGNVAGYHESWLGMVNTAGSGNAVQLYHYATPTIFGFLDQTKVRSDDGRWFLRLYGNCDYADNEIQMANNSWLLIEVDNGV